MAKKSTKLQAVSGLLSENNITSDSINLSDIIAIDGKERCGTGRKDTKD